jgi:hypothetical protein
VKGVCGGDFAGFHDYVCEIDARATSYLILMKFSFKCCL